jgi:signal transduction histidine kinase/ActR/RegA family two-component response regulator
MQAATPSLFARWSAQLAEVAVSRQWLVHLYLGGTALNSLVFYFLPPGYYNHQVNFWHALTVLLVWPLARYRPLVLWVVHGVSVLTWALLVYVTAHTGGVNSTTMIWFSIMAVSMLMVRGTRALQVWMLVLLLTMVGMKVAIDFELVDPHANVGPQGVPWTLMNYVLVTVSLMMAVINYEHMHRKQLQELGQRNDELRATHHALIQAQAHKDEFVAAVGHELRTPMNAILGFNSVLRRELADRPEEVEVVDHIRNSTAHLLEVVNDILDYSQLQAGSLGLYPEDFVLQDLVEHALHKHQLRAQRKGLRLQGHIDPALPGALHGDRQRLQQVIHKLLDNAVKFTAQGHVALRLALHEGRLRIEVEDTGPGIPPERQALIFNRFEHADEQTNRAFGGTGLGLTLCEGLTRLLGGEIGVHSRPGSGALFWLMLPLQVARGEPAPAETPVRSLAGEPLRILVVDDNAVNLQVAQLQLHKIWPQAQITTADSAAQALIILDEQVFDVALVDMVMPDMDGLELTHHIRQQMGAETSRMPVLALTANTNPVEREQCLAAGMDDVLHKPMDAEQIKRLIGRHVRRKRG